IARTLCLSPIRKEEAGRVRLLLVPNANTDGIERGEGIDPDFLTLTPPAPPAPYPQYKFSRS
ncbi:MAG: hypothetical protein RIM23_22310, partial [Coleofasciculus sp. G3-WIS-01]|uniref:hypothetical protein n=1 Tax=Coleofasciculus sp. G3-WIS-01 TaxID=3069528 RepID=UPI0032F84309